MNFSKSLDTQIKYRYGEKTNRLRTSCAPAVGRGDFKKPETEEGAVQPITAAIQNACRRRNTGTSHSHKTLVRQEKLGVSYIVTCQTKVDGKSISGKD